MYICIHIFIGEYKYMYVEVKDVQMLVHALVNAVQEYNMHGFLWSVRIFWRSCSTRLSRGSARALASSSKHRHASLHWHAPLCTSAVTLTRRSRRPQSNKPPILAAVYICSRRASSPTIHQETRSGKRASYDMQLLPATHVTQAVAPVAFE
jgi:hypothetical protein